MDVYRGPMVSSNIPTSGEPIVCIREKKAVSLPYVTLADVSSSLLLPLLSSAAAVVLRMSERTRYGSTGRWSWYDNAYSIMFMYVTAIAVDDVISVFYIVMRRGRSGRNNTD